MPSESSAIVQKLWNYCHVLRDDGVSYGDYVEQLTYLLFLKMADEQTKPPFNRPSTIPEKFDWDNLRKKDGDELEVHYPKDYDVDTMKLNVVNGTIDLRTGRLLPHNPADFITKLSPVEYDPDAQLDLWDEVLDTATDSDTDLQDFLQTTVGYSLTGDVGEEKLFFVHGPTATSKSTFLEAIKSTLGDYAETADFESFLRKPPQSGTLRNDIASLAGKRFVTSIEVDEGRKLAEGLIKILTGGDKIKARFLYHEGFEFVPQFKLWLAANHEPKISDNDDAIWRRIAKVPFTHALPKKDRKPTVKATLRNPAIAGSAILAWAVKGCLKWQKEGLVVPEVVERATENYRLEQDPLKVLRRLLSIRSYSLRHHR